MNWLKKGPELKMPKLSPKGPGIKPPAFLADLYYDLRDRRLLPLIALVAVAIAAVPILLGGSEPAPLPPVAADTGAGETETASASLAVVEAKPGLRDYRKRLGSRTATNPFEQRYTGLPDSAQVEMSVTSSSSGSSGETQEVEASGETVETEPSGGGSDGGTSPGSGGDGGGATQTYELVIDVQITRIEKTADGDEKAGEPEVRHDVPVLTQLPGKKTPVVTTLGANLQKERLVFLVSHQVKAVTGEFACISRGEVCELLEVELGTLLEFVYEPSGARYAIKVTNADVVPVRKDGGTRSSRAAFIAQNFSK